MTIPALSQFNIFTFDPTKTCKGNIYSFAVAGDELPIHSHVDHGHCTIVTAGSFVLFDDNGNERVLKKNDVVPQFTPGRPHGFRALEDNSEIINITIPGVV